MMGAKPLTMEELASLRALCDKATPGPWCKWSSNNEPVLFRVYGQHQRGVCEATNPAESQRECDIEYISSIDPATVRRLIAAAERSRRRPIATAPRDGTVFDAWDEQGVRYTNLRIRLDDWTIENSKGDGLWQSFKKHEHLIEWLPIPGEGGV